MAKSLDDVDLTVPGAIEQLMQEEDDSEEGLEDLPEDDSKRNAAFAKLRKKAKLQEKAIAQHQQKAKEREDASANGQGQPGMQAVASPNLSNEQQQALSYSRLVRSRAKEMTDKLYYPGMTQEEYSQLFYMNQQSILAADIVEKKSRDDLVSKAPEVVSSVLSKFDQLSDEDRKVVRSRLKDLDPAMKANPEIVRREVFAYLGEQSVKSDASREEDKKTRKRKSSSESSEEDGSWRDSPPDRIGPSQQSLGAAAAAVSERSGGSKGMKVPRQEQKAASESDASTLSKEDREMMRQTGLNPSDPEHVKRYKFGRKKKASPHLFG